MRSFRFSICFLQIVFFAVAVGLAQSPYEKSNLVRVHVVNEIRGAGNAVLIRGRLLDDYNPTVIQKFSSPGVVLDGDGHIMTFLGYGRIFIERKNSRFEIATSEGKLHKGELVGIDHGNGAAVIHVEDGKLVKTATCLDCDLREGTTVIAPVFVGPGLTQFQATQVMSVQSRGVSREGTGWVIRMNRPFLDIGQPFFTDDNRVLGFVVSQEPSGVRNVVYTVSDLLNSAQQIIRENKDIRTGWLGVYPEEIRTPLGIRVRIQRVEKESPAEEGGLSASDIVLRYNDRKIDDVLGLIQMVQNTPVGSSAKLDILRLNRPLTLTVSIREREYSNPLKDMMLDLQDPFGPPQAQIDPASTAGTARPRIGFDTVVLTPQLAGYLKIPRQTGLLVVNIVKQSAADLAGLKNGDVILSVNEKPVEDTLAVVSYLHGLDPGSIVSMKVLRRDSEQVISIQLPD